MKILYDMSVLGCAHYEPHARTGIYRVIENIALGLIASGDYDLVGYASLGNDSESLTYLGEHTHLSTCLESYVSGLASCKHVRFKADGINGLVQQFFDRFASNSLNETVTLPRVDLCHATYYPAPEVFYRQTRLPMVQTVYDLIPILFPHYFNRGDDHALRTVIERLTPEIFVICISESTRNDLCNFAKNVDPSRVFVTPLAASDEFYPCADLSRIATIRHKFGIPEQARYILSVCTLEPRKNVEMTIRSFVRLVQEQNVPDLYLVLTGTKGWKYEKILAEIEHAEAIRDRIIMTGFVPDEDLAPLYSGAMVFVYPSLYEGFGLPLLEAMQCGTPVITSNTSSMPEVVGDAGIMIDPADGDALCQAMLDYYHNESLLADFSEKALQRAKCFNWQRCTDETIAVYRQAVGG